VEVLDIVGPDRRHRRDLYPLRKAQRMNLSIQPNAFVMVVALEHAEPYRSLS
jgi:hypothetical protein